MRTPCVKIIPGKLNCRDVVLRAVGRNDDKMRLIKGEAIFRADRPGSLVNQIRPEIV